MGRSLTWNQRPSAICVSVRLAPSAAPGERSRGREEIGGRLDVTEIGRAVEERGRYRYDCDVEVLETRRIGGGAEPTGAQRPAQVVIAHVVDERLGASERTDPISVHVEADDIESRIDRSQRNRQTDIALPHDDDPL